MLKKDSSLAVAVLSSLWENKPDSEDLSLEYIDDRIHGLCRDEKFVDDPSVPYACTGFLVGPDLLVTAGHCSVNSGGEIFNTTDNYCESYTWLFDYQFDHNGQINLENISSENVFKCKEIIYAVYDESRDFALIRLDKKVQNRPHFEVEEDQMRVSQRVNVMGFPAGQPLKEAPGRVIDVSDSLYMINSDAMGGNSGSPVFNKDDKVIGVLIGGRPNEIFYTDRKNRCDRFNRCNNRGQNCKAGNEENLAFPITGIEVFRFDQFYDIENLRKKSTRSVELQKLNSFKPYRSL